MVVIGAAIGAAVVDSVATAVDVVRVAMKDRRGAAAIAVRAVRAVDVMSTLNVVNARILAMVFSRHRGMVVEARRRVGRLVGRVVLMSSMLAAAPKSAMVVDPGVVLMDRLKNVTVLAVGAVAHNRMHVVRMDRVAAIISDLRSVVRRVVRRFKKPRHRLVRRSLDSLNASSAADPIRRRCQKNSQ